MPDAPVRSLGTNPAQSEKPLPIRICADLMRRESAQPGPLMQFVGGGSPAPERAIAFQKNDAGAALHELLPVGLAAKLLQLPRRPFVWFRFFCKPKRSVRLDANRLHKIRCTKLFARIIPAKI